MNFLTDKIKPMYFKYLKAAFGSALITSIYGIVDMSMVGQYQGPDGTAALAVVAPIWNIIYSLGLLMGIGGSILLSTVRGQDSLSSSDPSDVAAAGKTTGTVTRTVAKSSPLTRSNEYFTTALIGVSAFAVLAWLMIIFFDKPLLLFFGADASLLPLARRYLVPVKFVIPAFLFNQFLAAFLRNDKNPGLATRAVLIGGIFNIFGDYFFVFPMDMGIFGAGLATALGSVISLVVMLTHFFRKENTLRIVRPAHLLRQTKQVLTSGFSAFFIDVAMGILTIFFNKQIMHYLGANALAVYGVIINISTFVQCCAYSVGQAAQPIISTNYGAGKGGRIRETLKYALGTTAFFAIFWTALSLAVPNGYIKVFMSPTSEILKIAPRIIRSYSISFLLLPLNIFSTYYFQALLKPTAAFVVSIARGMILSGLFIFILPMCFGADSLWFAMPLTELVIAVYVVYHMRKYTHALPE